MSDSYTVDIPRPKALGEVAFIGEWAKKNCPSLITVDAVRKTEGNIQYRFYFSLEKDAVWFALRWL